LSTDPSAVALSEVAASSDPLPKRAEAMLGALRRMIPFDGAWLALVDPQHNSYSTLASTDLSDSTLQYLCGPDMARDIDITGTNRKQPPLSPSDLPYSASELPTWAECLIPGGYREALAIALFAPDDQRHVGFLALLSGDTRPPGPTIRRLLGQLTPILARGIDPLRSLVSAARLVQGASAGVVLRTDGGTEALPGLPGHALLQPDSLVLTAARGELGTGIYASFLWPLGGRHAPRGHARVTALAATDDVPDTVAGMALVSPPGDVQALTPRELEVLGLMIKGRSNGEISRDLVVAQRTVAAHVEHILAKLGVSRRAQIATWAATQIELSS
jgi:DNA-binding CsgD family transcriptional regulator